MMMVSPIGVGTVAAASSVSGTVTDSNGNAVEGATVEFVDGNDTVVATATTDANGTYSVSGLSDSTSYTVEVTADGYADSSQSYSTGTGTSETVDVTLGTEYTSTVTPDDAKTPSQVFVELAGTNQTTVTVEAKVDGNWTQVNSTTVTPSSAPRAVSVDVSGYTGATEYRVSVVGQEPTDTGIAYTSGGVVWTGEGGGSLPVLAVAAGVGGVAYYFSRE